MSALDNAIEILRCFAPHQPEISNADVIRLTGKPKSSTSRLLRQLKGMRAAGAGRLDPPLSAGPAGVRTRPLASDSK
jgi:hypothetical protein